MAVSRAWSAGPRRCAVLLVPPSRGTRRCWASIRLAIERQEADCRAWAERNDLEVRRVHIDRGRSGFKAVERAGFDAAVAAVTSGVVGRSSPWLYDDYE